MKKKAISIGAIFSLCFAVAFGVVAAPAGGAEPYQLREGDSLLISVWREEALQREVRVLPDGSITFPLVGRLIAAGASVADLERRLAERLSRFLSEPEVTVAVASTDGNRVYVLGKVVKPGPIAMPGPMNVLQALSIAGGLDTFADADAVRVLRETVDGQEVFPVRYGDLLKGRRLESNVALKAGDVILVP